MLSSRVLSSRAKAASVAGWARARSIIGESVAGEPIGPSSTRSVRTPVPRRSACRPEVKWLSPAFVAA